MDSLGVVVTRDMSGNTSSVNNRYSDHPSVEVNDYLPVRTSANSGMITANSQRSPLMHTRCRHTDWDLCEQLRLQELGEARTRAAQMEKTMRWWSECTASWREKWGTVRDERNRAREECEVFKSGLGECQKLVEQANEEKRRLETELSKANGEIRRLNKMNSDHEGKATAVLNLIKEGQLAHRTGGQAHEIVPPVPTPSGEMKSDQTDLTTKCKNLEAANQNLKIEMDRIKRSFDEKLQQAKVTAKDSCADERVQSLQSEVEMLKMEKQMLMQQLKSLKETAEQDTNSSSAEYDSVQE